MTKWIKFEDALRKDLKDPEFKKIWEEQQPEFEIIRAILNARINKGMTQKQLAKKMGTKQPVISRLEQGTLNPSLKFLKRVAKALDSKLTITIS